MIKITLKGDTFKEFESPVTVLDIARSISEGLGRDTACAMVDGEICDIRHLVSKDAKVDLYTIKDKEGMDAFRHTTAHVLSAAVKNIWPEVKLSIGPAIENGFYYDFDKDGSFSAEDLPKIEAEMKKIIKENKTIEMFVLPRSEAIELMKKENEDYKIELIESLTEDAIISFYKIGDHVDLCKGPHLSSLKNIKAFKLIQVAGAYFKGDEKNKMLARIYGTSFPKKSELDEYLEMMEEAKKRDHNKLGRELGLFTTSDVIGQGLPLLMPKGAKVVQLLQRFVEDEEERRGYVLTKTPLFAKSDLYKVSGHWDHYKDGMFILGDEEKDEEIFALRPMTCPFQFTIYNAEQHSYRDLPIRYGETSTLFRKESSGEMHGLIRVRQFTISEGHLVCTKDQLKEEFRGVVDLVNYMMDVLGIGNDITYRFSKWDPNNKEKYEGNAEVWEETQNLMRELLDELKLNYHEAEGEAAFYGPKLDIQFKNVYGKEDTIITIQIDYSLAEKFNMTYVNSDGEKKHPIIIHRTSIGCYERTLAMLIEKYAGAFPVWLSPIQVKILSLSDKYNEYAEKLREELKTLGIRAQSDLRGEKIGYKIREARSERLPYILVVGEQEASQNTVSLRSRKNGDEGSVPFEDFKSRLLLEVTSKDK